MRELYIASAALCLFYVFLLLTKKSGNPSDRILTAWMGLIFIAVCSTYVLEYGSENWFWILELADSSSILHGPFAWFYTLSLTRENFRFKRKDYLHTVPFLLALSVVFIPFFQGHSISGVGRNTLMVAKLVIAMFYLVQTLQELGRHRHQVSKIFSSDSALINLNWLRLLIFGFLIILIVSIISQFSYYFFGWEIRQFGGFYTNLLVALFVFIIGYFGFRQTTIFIPAHLISAQSTASEYPTNDEKVTVNVTTDHTDLEGPYKEILQYMADHKPHLDADLSLYKLADRLELPPHQLSTIINQYGGTNFFDFVNQYRVTEVKLKIKDGDANHMTLLALALASGFNSKAAFNRAFKKFTGMTPSLYRKDMIS